MIKTFTILLLSVFLCLLCILPAHAATITSNATGNWSAGGTWVGGTPPTSTDDVVIANSHNVTVDGIYSCASLTINTGGTSSSVIITAGNSLTVSGATTINGPSANVDKYVYVNGGDFTTASVVMTDGGGNGRDAYIQIGTGTCTVTGNITMDGTNLISYIYFSGAGTLFIGGAFGGVGGGGITSNANGAATAPTSGTVDFNSIGNQNIPVFSGYYNLTLSGSATKTALGVLTVNSNVIIESGVTFALGGATTVGGDWTNNNGALTAGGNTVTFTAIGGFITGTSSTNFAGLYIGSTTDVDITLEIDATCTAFTIGTGNRIITFRQGDNITLTVNGNAVVNQSTAAGRAHSWNIDGGISTISGTLSFVGANNGANLIGKVEITSGSLTVTLSVIFDSNTTDANQIITITGNGTANFNSTVATLATTVYSDGTLSITGNGTMNFSAFFDMEGGTVDLGAAGIMNFNKTGATAFRYNTVSTPTFTTNNGSTLNFNGDLTTLAALTFANGSYEKFTGASTITPTAAVVFGNVTINTGITVILGGNIALTNDWTNSGGALTPGTRKVTFQGTGTQTITNAAGEIFYDLTSNTTGPIVLASNTDVKVTNILTMTAGTYDLGGRTFTLGLGSAETASTLTRTGSATTNWLYNGTFKRYWPTVTAVTITNYGLFPMGTAEASTYRPVEIASTVSPTGTNGYTTVQHVDVSKITDLNPVYNDGGTNIVRISDAQFVIATSGFTAGTFNINATMTGLSSTGPVSPTALIRLAAFTGGTTASAVGAHADATYTSADNPTAKRTGVTYSELNNDFRISTTNSSTAPLRDMYFSRNGGGNWNAAATWSTATCNGAAAGSAPPANAYCTICSGDAVDINVSSTCDFVEIQAGGTLTGSVAAQTFTVNKDMTTAGTGTFSHASTGTWAITRNLTLAGSVASSCNGAALNVTGKVSVGGGTTLTLGQNSTFTGNLTVDGTLAIGATTLTLNGASTTIGGSAGAASITGTGIVDITTSSKSIVSGTNITIAPQFRIAAGITVTNNGTVSLNNNLVDVAGSSTWTNAANSTLNITGSLLAANPGILNANAVPNTVNYNGAGAQTVIQPSSTYYNLTCSNAGLKTFGFNMTVNGLVTIQNNAILTDAGGNRNLIGTAGLTMTDNSELRTSRRPPNPRIVPQLSGAYNLIGGTITLNANGTVSLRNISPSSYYNIDIETNGTTTLRGNTIISNNLIIGDTYYPAASRLDVNATIYNLTIGGNWNVTSTHPDPFIERTGLVTFNGSASQTISTVLAAGETFYNMTVGNTIGVLFSNTDAPIVTTITNDLTINSLAVLNANNQNIDIRGNWINNGGTFTPGTGTVDFKGTTQSITKSSAETFNNLTLSNSGTKTLNCDISAASTLTIAGTASMDINTSNYAVAVGDDWTVTSTNADPFVQRSGTVTFNGSALQDVSTVLVAGETFYDLIITNNINGVKLLTGGGGAYTISNDLTIDISAKLDANGRSINLAGDWINNGGTFTPNANTVTINGTVPQSITKSAGETFYNLTSNTTGPITFEGTTDVTVTNQLTMTAGLFNLNGRTLAVGASGATSTLSRTGGWCYGGTFKRFWPNVATPITVTNYGLFPMGTSSASSYRPVEISTTVDATGAGSYVTVLHTDASTVTDLAGSEGIVRISDAQFVLSSTGITAGTFNLNVTMTGLSSTGPAAPSALIRLAKSDGTVVGTHADYSGTPDNPTGKRTALAGADLNYDFRIASTNTTSAPLREFYYSRVASGNWNAAATWSTVGCGGSAAGSAPPANAYCIICNGHTVDVNVSSTCDFVEIQSGGILTGSVAAQTFTVNKDLSTAGTGYFTHAATGTWTVTRNATLAGTGSSSCAGAAFNVTGNLSVGGNTTLTLGVNSTVSGDLNVDGTLAIGTTTLTLDGNSKNIGGYAGAASITGGGTLSVTTGNKTVLSSANLTIAPVFSIATGLTLTNNGTVSCTGNITGGAASSVWTNAASSTLNAGAALLAVGILNANTLGNTVNYNGGGAQSVKTPSSSTYYNLSISNAGTKTFDAAGTITVSNLLTVQGAAIMDVSTNTLNGAGGVTMTGTAQLKLAKSATVPELTGTYTISGGTIVLNGSGIQTVRSLSAAPSAYYNLTLANDQVKSLAGNISVQNNISIEGTAQLDVTASNRSIEIKGNWDVIGTALFVERSGTVTFNGTSAQTITTYLAAGETFNHLVIANSSGVSPVGKTLNVAGNLTINSGATLNSNSQDITVGGNWTNSGGTFLYGVKKVTFNGATQSISKATAETFYDIEFFGTGTTTLGCPLTVLRHLKIGNATASQLDVSVSNYAITIAGNWTVNSANADPFVERSGSTTYNGTVLQTITTNLAAGETFYNLNTSNNADGIILASKINVSGNLSITSGANFNAAGFQIGMLGNWTNNNGNFIHGNNTVVFSGSANKTITSTNTAIFYNLETNTTGLVSFEAATDITIANKLTMTAGNININSRTLTLGNGSGAELVYTAGVAYGGNFTRYLPIATAISSTVAPKRGLFPVGSSIDYRPVEVNSVAGPTTGGYLTATHTDASDVADITYTDNEGHSIERVTNMKSTLAASGGFAGGSDYQLNITFTGLTTTGTALTQLKMLTYTSSVPGSAGTTDPTTGSFASPKVGRTSLTAAQLENDFVVGTKNKSTDPLRDFYYSRVAGPANWDDPNTWSTAGCGGAAAVTTPPTNAYCVICNTHTVTVNTASQTDYVEIQNGGTLVGGSPLIVNKDITTTGIGVFAPTGGLWTISRNATLNGGGSSSCAAAFNVTGNLSVGTGSTLTLSTASTVSGNLNVDGTLAIGATTLTLNGNSSKTISGSSGAATITGGGIMNITTAGKTFSAGTNLTINPELSITGAITVTNNGTISLNNNLTGSAGGSTWTNAANATLNITGTLLVTGTLNATALDNTVNYNAAGAQTVKQPSSSTYYNLKVSISGTKTFATGGTLTVTNLCTIQDAAIFNVSTNTLNGGAGLVMSGTAELQLAKTGTTLPELTGTGNYNITGGTITFNGAGAQTALALNAVPVAYYNVDFGNSGIKTLAGATTVQGEFKISGSAQLDVSASNYAITLKGNWNNNGSNANPFIERSGTVTCNGTALQTIDITGAGVTSETFYNLVIDNATGVQLQDPVNAVSSSGSGNSLTIQSGASFDANSKAITLTGDWLNNGGAFTPGTGTVTFNGTGAQSITKPSTATFYNITFNGTSLTSVTTLACNLTVQNDLTIGGVAQLDVSASNYAINIAGDWAVTSTNGNPFTERSGTVTFNGSAAQTQSSVLPAGETFYNLTISNTVGVSLTSTGIPTNVSTLLTIAASAILDANGRNMNIAGSWTNNGGTFTPGAGTVTFNGTGTQTITKTGGETFSNITSNATGTITLANNVTVTNTLTMTSGLYNLNGNTLALGAAGAASTLSRAASSTTNWCYGGTFKRFLPNAATTITITNYGLLPMGTSSVSSYRPVEISTTVDATGASSYVTAQHVDASTVTDLAGSEGIVRVSDAQFILASSGITAGTFNLNVTMTGMSTTGPAAPSALIRLAKSDGTVVGTHADYSGTPANPTAKRTGLAGADLNYDFRIASTNTTTAPLRQIYYSRKTGNWNDATVGDATWSLTNGGAGASCDCVPPANGYAVISNAIPPQVVSVTDARTIEFVDIEDGATLNGTANFAVTKDLTTAGAGTFAPTAGTWTISRNATLAGSGSSSLTGTTTVAGNLSVGAGTTLTMNGGNGITVSGNLNVDGTLALGTSTITLNGSTKTITGSTGAASITGGSAIVSVSSGAKTISAGANLTIAPEFSIGAGVTVTNSGTITLTGNLTGVAANSTWVNENGSVLNVAGTVLIIGTLTATNTNTVNYNGAGAQSVKAPSVSYYNLTISTSGTKTSSGTITVTNLCTIQDAAVFNVSTNTLNGGGGLVMSGTAALQLAKTGVTLPELTGTGTYNITAGTITFNGAGAQTVRALNSVPAAYYNVDFGNTGIKTLAGAITVQGELKISGTAQLDVSASNYAISALGNWNNDGSHANPFIEQSGTVTFGGSATQTIATTTIASETFYNLVINNSSGVQLLDPVNVTSSTGSGNSLTIQAGAVLDANNFNISLTGDWTDNGGTFTPGTAMVTFAGNAAQAITKSSTATFYDITFNGSASTTTLGCNIVVQRDLLIDVTAKLDVSASNYSIDIARHWTVTSTDGNPFTERNGTVTFNGSVVQNQSTILGAGETFYKLTISNTEGATGVTLTSGAAIPTNVTNLLTISAGSFLTANNRNMNIAGNWTNSGTFTPGTGTVTFNGAGTQTITRTGGETFYNFTGNATGTITLANNATVTNTLTMTSGVYNLNANTLALGVAGAASTLSRAASSTTNWCYGGTFKRFWPNAATTITITNYGLLPMGTSSASSYRPVEISTTVDATGTSSYVTAQHVDASTVTDLAGSEGIVRVSDAQFILASSGITAGTFNLNVTMTGMSSTGPAAPSALIRLAKSDGTVVGTHADYAGTPANPTAKRTGLAGADLNYDFRIASTNTTTAPLRQIYYSRKTGNWNDATVGDATWSLTSGGAGGSCDCVPPANGYAVISAGQTVTITDARTIEFVDIEGGATLNGTANFIVSKDITTAGAGVFAPTSGTWTISRNATLAGTGSSSLSGTTTVAGNLSVGTGTTLTMSGGAGITVSGNLAVDGTLALGTSAMILNGGGKTISGSAGAASITGASASITVPNSKTISAGTNLTIAPIVAISGVTTVTNNGTITLTGNLTGTVGASTWTNAAGSVLNTSGTVLATGTLDASASNTVNYNNAGAQTIKIPSVSYYNLTVSNSGTKTFATAGTVSVTNLCSVQGAVIFNVSTNTLNGSAGLVMSGTAELQLASTGVTLPELTGTGTYNITAGTITFNGAGAQTVRALNSIPAAYYNVDFGNSGVKTLAGATTVQGELKISGTAQLDVSASNYAIIIQGNWNVTGSNANPFIEQSGTVTFNGSAAQTIATPLASETFYNMVINNSAGLQLLDPINVTSSTGSGNSLTIQSGAVLDANNLNITITGNWTDNGGTFTPGTSTVTFNGTGSQTITKSSAATFNNIIFNGASGTPVTTLACNLTVQNDMTIGGIAQLDVNTTNNSINIAGDWAVTSTNGNPFVERSGTVTFNGSAAQTQSTALAAGETFYNLTISNTVGVSLTSAAKPTNVSNLLTISASAILDANGNNMNIAGNWTNSGGTFTYGAGTVTFNGTGTQTITGTEIFGNFTCNATGPVTLAGNVTVTNTLNMTAGLFNLNSNTLALGSAGGASTLSRTGSTTTNWCYGGTFKRFWPNAATTITVTNYGLFPMGTSAASSYRPVEISTTVDATGASSYVTAQHVDASTVTDLAGSEGIVRVSDAQFILASSGITGGTFNLNVTMTGLSTTGPAAPSALIRLAKSDGTVVGTHADYAGTPANPTAKRTSLAGADLAYDFRVASTDIATAPLRQIYYSRKTGNWNDATVGDATWSLTGGGAGASCDCVPPANGYAVISDGQTVSVTDVRTIEFVDIKNTAILNGTANFTVTKDLTALGVGKFEPTTGTWLVSRDLSLNGTSASSTSTAAMTVSGKLKITSTCTLTLNGNLTIGGDLQMDGTLAMGANNLTVNGAAKTISGSTGAATVSGSGTITLTNNKSIAAGATLSVAPAISVSTATTVTNNGTVTITNNITGTDATSIWTNAANSILNITGALLSTGALTATANPNTVNYNNAGAQSVKTTSYYNLTLANSGTKTYAAAGTISVAGTLTIQDAVVFNASTNTLDGTGGLTMSGTSALQLAKTGTIVPELGGTYNITAGTITFNGAGAQSIKSLNLAPAVYYNVDFGNSGVKTLDGAITVQGELKISGTAQLDVVSGSNYAIAIAGNWNVTGTNADPLIERSGTVTMNGTAAQTVTTALAAGETFNNLTANNTFNRTNNNAEITFSSPVTVNGTLNMTDGHIGTTGANILTMGTSASTTLAGSPQDSSFVIGPMQYKVNVSAAVTKVFALGKNNVYRRLDLKVDQTTAGTNTYKAEMFLSEAASGGCTSLPGTITHLSTQRYYDVIISSGTEAIDSAQVTIYYDCAGLNDYVNDEPNLTIAKIASDCSGSWSDLYVSGNYVNTATCGGTYKSGYIKSGSFTTFSRFAKGNRNPGVGNPLPVSLLSFGAELKNSKVDVTWTTAIEINNNFFTVEKTKDGNVFEEAAKVKGAGNSNEIRAYFVVDKYPYKGISYYRLKQTDFDGKFTYSDMVAVNNPDGKEVVFTVYPNPSDGNNINVSVSGFEKNEEVLVVLTNIHGKQIFSKVILTDDNGVFITGMDPHKNLPAGIYFIVGSSRSDIFSRKLVIR